MPDDALPHDAFIAVLDTLIPARNESLPGAGSLGIGERVEPKLGPVVELIAAALAALDALAQDRSGVPFAELPVEERAPLVDEVAANHPGFVESLVFHAYTSYYQHPRVSLALGLRPGPPHPEGYELEMGDLGLLAPVRRREKFYREV
ncbi:MAG: gluconate 2-dehydrogenase subunit 3 family protein [Deltaproteobacteria bacterium]|nr:gluconate 2-dehydrogenase subunit 3 family protein [Deltaproteobacteria bacterium]